MCILLYVCYKHVSCGNYKSATTPANCSRFFVPPCFPPSRHAPVFLSPCHIVCPWHRQHPAHSEPKHHPSPHNPPAGLSHLSRHPAPSSHKHRSPQQRHWPICAGSSQHSLIIFRTALPIRICHHIDFLDAQQVGTGFQQVLCLFQIKVSHDYILCGTHYGAAEDRLHSAGVGTPREGTHP